MKTRLLLIMLVALFINAKQSHASEVFPTSDAIWVIHLYNHDGGRQYVYGLSGDTLINEKTYQKLYLLNDTTLTIDSEDIYVAGIRQTAGKQVWIQPTDKKDGSKFEEYLMYDFSKEVGDEIIIGKRPLWLINNINLEPTFENIDPEEIGILDVKVRNIEVFDEYIYMYIYSPVHYSDEIWLEGVGSLTGLFFFTPLRFPSGAGNPSGAQLICMKKGDSVKYLAEDCTSCFKEDIYLSITSNEINDNISISYISVKKTVEIKFNEGNCLSEFSLMTIDGKRIISDIITDTNTSINVNNFPKGIYLYTLVGDHITQSGKLIIK